MQKAPIPTEMSKGQSDNTDNTTKKSNETAIADRLATVSWSNYIIQLVWLTGLRA